MHLGFNGTALQCTVHSDGCVFWEAFTTDFFQGSSVGGVSWQGFQQDLGIPSAEFCPFWKQELFLLAEQGS